MFNLDAIRDDDDNIYESANDDDTSYNTVRTHKSQPSLGSVIINDNVSMKSLTSAASSKSTAQRRMDALGIVD